MIWLLKAISSREFIAQNKHPLRGCFHLVLISQLSRLKQCGISVLLKDTTYWVARDWTADFWLDKVYQGEMLINVLSDISQ